MNKPIDDPAARSTVNSGDRYDRQVQFAPLGRAGQERLAQGRVAIVGLGALGSTQASILARAGVGSLILIDRDFVEISNLQRQLLYDEQDVEQALPKAEAARRKLNAINSSISLTAAIDDLDHRNIERLCGGADVILDGTDNFETRFLINDFSIARGIPWVYGGCVGSDGQTMTIIPGETACLHCLMLEGPPPPGATETCDSAGILGAIVQVIAAIQANEAIKLLAGQPQQTQRGLISFNLWDNQIHQIDLSQLRSGVDCPACQHHQATWLRGAHASQTSVLCGRNAVQLAPARATPIDLSQISRRLQSIGHVTSNPYLIKLQSGRYELVLFPNGRAIIKGTENVAKAKSLYAQWVGH